MILRSFERELDSTDQPAAAAEPIRRKRRDGLQHPESRKMNGARGVIFNWRGHNWAGLLKGGMYVLDDDEGRAASADRGPDGAGGDYERGSCGFVCGWRLAQRVKETVRGQFRLDRSAEWAAVTEPILQG